MIKAPFNFVPLPDKVVFPEWGEQVSHDIPFKDGLSGVIDLDIEALQPIFVRNGNTQNKKENSFSNIDNKYFIPATTLKGAFRTALEILSFGKMSRFVNHSFAFRDLGKSPDGKKYLKLMRKNAIVPGWLYRNNGNYYIAYCDEITSNNRISMKEIDRELGKVSYFEDFILRNNFSSDDDRTAKKKYEMLAKAIPVNDSEKRLYANGEKFYYIKDRKGYLVFTGQPGKRDPYKKTGKHKEFIFSRSPQDLCPKQDEMIMPEEFAAFESIYNSSPDYENLWKDKLKKDNCPVPVFYQVVKPQNENEDDYIYFGLAYMFKYPTKYDVGKVMEKYYSGAVGKENNIKKDMADLIFGYQDKKQSLRGRVSVGYAFAVGEPSVERELVTLMSSPRPAYYPLYLKWNRNPVTWDNDFKGSIEIGGYKRYPVRNSTIEGMRVFQPETQLSKMESTMIPLSAGTKFTGKIVFHNLKPVELGALLYSISLINPAEGRELYHNIGACKPYGYGKVRIKPTVKIQNQENSQDYYKIFSDYMEKVCRNNWRNSSTIMELQAMSKGIPDNMGNKFSYMEMDMDHKINKFKEGKEDYYKGIRLGSFTQIINNRVPDGSVPQIQNQHKNGYRAYGNFSTNKSKR